MISAIPNETWFCKESDIPNLPTDAAVKNGQTVLTDEGNTLIFVKDDKVWKNI